MEEIARCCVLWDPVFDLAGVGVISGDAVDAVTAAFTADVGAAVELAANVITGAMRSKGQIQMHAAKNDEPDFPPLRVIPSDTFIK